MTVELPRDLLRKAQKATGLGVTATIHRALELVAASRAAEERRRVRGRLAFSLDRKKLRADRRRSPSTPAP